MDGREIGRREMDGRVLDGRELDGRELFCEPEIICLLGSCRVHDLTEI